VDTKLYHTQVKLHLTPRSNNGDPEIRIIFDNNIVYHGLLSESRVFEIDNHLPNNDYQLSVELLNKQDIDTDVITGADKAVIIDRIIFNGIEDNRFIWAGEYCPEYPEPWYSEQATKPEPLLKSHTYLSWNGKWTLTFAVPVFTWIHKVQNLGWIYD
jgi:hypothetical protein